MPSYYIVRYYEVLKKAFNKSFFNLTLTIEYPVAVWLYIHNIHLKRTAISQRTGQNDWSILPLASGSESVTCGVTCNSIFMKEVE